MTDLKKEDIYIIAEAGVNHNGDFNLAKKLIEAAKTSGADAIKFQSFKTEKLVTNWVHTAHYQKKILPNKKTQYQLLKGLEFSENQFEELKLYCDSIGIDFLSTPFDDRSIDFLSDIGVKYIKISSGDLTNLPLIWYSAKKNIPLIISSGMASLGDIELALATIHHALTNKKEPKNLNEIIQYFSFQSKSYDLLSKTTILHCSSLYPTALEDVNLTAMITIKNAFGLTVGFSDHSLNEIAAISAAALGASMIEKHLTLDTKMIGPDHISSLSVRDFKSMVSRIREVTTLLGEGKKYPLPNEWKSRKVALRHIVAKSEIYIGDEFDKENLAVLRSENGIAARHFWDLMGKKSRKNYEKGKLIHPLEIDRELG